MDKNLILGIIIALASIIISIFIVQNKEQTLASGLNNAINETRTEMEKTAQTTGLAQSDSIADSIIRDCSVRDRYEKLLGNLNNLSQEELIEVQKLHAQCSHYYPAQKALLVNRLENQFNQYVDLINLLDNVKAVDDDNYNVQQWQSLISKENTRSELLRTQYDLQGKIINALVNKNNETLKILIDEAKKIADSLNVISIQINNEREALINI